MKFKKGITYVVRAGTKISEKDKAFLKKHISSMDYYIIEPTNMYNTDIIIHYFDGYSFSNPLCISTSILNNNNYNGTAFFTPKRVIYYNQHLDIE